jgi:hypothetical protein
MLYGNLLLAPGAVALKCLQLCCERPGQFVERALGAILLVDPLELGESLTKGHGRHVDRGHLGRQHRLKLIPRRTPFTTESMKLSPCSSTHGPIELALLNWAEKALQEILIRGTERLHQGRAADEFKRIVGRDRPPASRPRPLGVAPGWQFGLDDQMPFFAIAQ